MKFVFFGPPIAKARARHSKITSKCYDTQVREKKYIRQVMERQIKTFFDEACKEQLIQAEKLLHSDGFSVDLVFHMPIPASWQESRKNLARWGRIYPTSKPDVDNLEKFYLDAANELLWKDDAAVVSMRSKKIYSDQPLTEMIIMPMNPNTPVMAQEILQCISPSEVAKLAAGFENVLECLMESDIVASAETLGKLTTEYSQKLNKICKIKQKWDDFEKRLIESEAVKSIDEYGDEDEEKE